MKDINEVLNKNQLDVVDIFKKNISRKYEIASIIIFGSTVRGEGGEGSDLDILVVTKTKLSHQDRHEIQKEATKLNWQYDTNISTIIVDEYNWEKGLYSLMLIKEEVLRDGVTV